MPQIRPVYRKVDLPVFAPRYKDVAVPADVLGPATSFRLTSMRSHLKTLTETGTTLNPQSYEELSNVLSGLQLELNFPTCLEEYEDLWASDVAAASVKNGTVKIIPERCDSDKFGVRTTKK